MIQLITTIFSFFFGFFAKQKIENVSNLKKEIKQYENMQALQQEINNRTIINNDVSDLKLQFKKNREEHGTTTSN